MRIIGYLEIGERGVEACVCVFLFEREDRENEKMCVEVDNFIRVIESN